MINTNSYIKKVFCNKAASCFNVIYCKILCYLLQNIKADLDEMQSEAHISEQKAQSAMIDAARLADELRAEQVDIFTRTE